MMAKANSLLGRAILLSLGFFVPAGSLLAQPPNLLQNPGFDVDLSHWTTEGSVVWSPVDADDDPDSGSALVDGGGGGSYIHQCVAVEANAGYLAKVLILYDPKPVKDDEARMRIFW
ncbi:MAG: hypothetical protein GY722_24730, partial [bacterium]|nr:hypothetical protein [bacterium]